MRTYTKLHIILFGYIRPVANRQCASQTLLLKASTMKKDLFGSCSL